MNLDKMIITKIIDIVTISSPKNRFEKMANRKSYGLSFTSDGQITYVHNGKSYVSNKNQAILLPKGESYTIHGDKAGSFPVINFEAANFCENKMVTIPINNIESIYKDFEQMKRLSLFKEQNLAVMSIFYNILHTLSRNQNSKFNPLAPALVYLENNYSCDVTNIILANQCGISEEHFRKLFKKTYGVSPKQYIIDIRITKAKQLLKEAVLKIGSIAEMCGFSDQYHFCRVFKQKTGMSPSEYSKNNRIFKI